MAHEGGGGSGGVLRELIAVFGFGVDTHELEKGESKLGEFFEKVKHVAEGVAAAFAVEQLYEFAEGQAKVVTAVEHTAAQIGISTEAVQAWQFAAQASGFESDKFTTAMSRLQVAAAKGDGAFKGLGITTKDASGKTKDAATLFADVAEAVKDTEDPNKRAAIATKLFGRAGRELLPFLAEGKEGISELTGKFKEYGQVITAKDIDKTKKFEGANAGLGASFSGLKLVIARAVLPIFTKVLEISTKVVSYFANLVKGTHLVEVALGLLAAAALYFAAPMLAAAAPVILFAAAIAGLVLLIEDLVGMFEGKDSVIGRAIDKMFGKGAHVNVVKELKQAWQDIKTSFMELWPYVKKVWDAFAWLIEHLPGIQLIAAAFRNGAEARYAKEHPESPSVIEDKKRKEFEDLGVKTGIGNPFGSYVPHTSFQLDGPQSPSGYAGAGGSAAGDTTIVNHTHVTVGEETIHKTVRKVIKKEHREAAVTAQRAGNPE